ncbi:MAG TPA: type 1 glutamine amidotransferase [Thiobacillaceae bacterium]|nr:type 1 glutamine amidotransferase [Thiobacillaceae bacterium]
MKPVVIFRFSQTEGPGYLGDFLAARGIPQDHINVDTGDTIPGGINGYAGLVLMGGPMSVNDELPWIEPVLHLVRDAVRSNVPVLGHCLGGQLMSKALGGTVTRNPIKEIGWGSVSKVGGAAASPWLDGLPDSFEVFQWHGETFSIPPGAQHLLRNDHCTNQAYLVNDRHLGLQCHVEMTAPMIRAWCEIGANEIAEAEASPAVQPAGSIQENMAPRLSRLNRVADRLYSRWVAGLAAS